jgi:endonuclease/exonuclease/phosphatase family metal-dependent hydrolase
MAAAWHGRYRRLRRAFSVAVCVVCAAVLTASSAAGTVPGSPYRVLQLNLCDSGIAGCYTGQAVAEAAMVIRARSPDVVTLNEICRDDLVPLGRAFADAHQKGTVASAFAAALDRRTGGDFRCRNGQSYGIGLLVYIPAQNRGYTTQSGVYPVQDMGDPEERVWLCVRVTAAFDACTTHLANTSQTVALAQCRYLMNVAVPSLRRNGGYQPAVLGGDLNLRDGGAQDVRSCVPPDYLRRDDGAVQHVLATTDFAIGTSTTLDMAGTTDHLGLLVALVPLYAGRPHSF